MTNKNEPKEDVQAEKAATKDAPKFNETGVAEEDMVEVGRVSIPEGTQVNLVPASDGNGGMVMVPADEPGHPDITTSPLS